MPSRHAQLRQKYIHRFPTQVLDKEQIVWKDKHTLHLHNLSIFPSKVVEMSITRQDVLERETQINGVIHDKTATYSANLFVGAVNMLYVEERPST